MYLRDEIRLLHCNPTLHLYLFQKQKLSGGFCLLQTVGSISFVCLVFISTLLPFFSSMNRYHSVVFHPRSPKFVKVYSMHRSVAISNEFSVLILPFEDFTDRVSIDMS